MGGGGGGGRFKGTKGASIKISDQKMHKDSTHFNKHGRAMGYQTKKEYETAVKYFARKYQDHPEAKVSEGRWSGGGRFHTREQRIITYGNKTVIVDSQTGQIVTFYEGSEYRGLYDIKSIR